MFEDYFNEIWGNIPKYTISDEYRVKNAELIESITYDLYRIHDQNGRLDATLATYILSNIFTSLVKVGVR